MIMPLMIQVLLLLLKKKEATVLVNLLTVSILIKNLTTIRKIPERKKRASLIRKILRRIEVHLYLKKVVTRKNGFMMKIRSKQWHRSLSLIKQLVNFWLFREELWRTRCDKRISIYRLEVMIRGWIKQLPQAITKTISWDKQRISQIKRRITVSNLAHLVTMQSLMLNLWTILKKICLKW